MKTTEKKYSGKIKQNISLASSSEQHRYERELTIVNPRGIHARPAALFVKAAIKYESTVEVYTSKKRADGKSIMGVATLEAYLGDKITILVNGNGDAEACFDELVSIVESGFGEKDEK